MFQYGKIFCNYVILKLLWILKMFRNAELGINVLTILTGKHCFTRFSVRTYWNSSLATINLFHMFRQSVKFYIPLSHIKESSCLKKVIHQIEIFIFEVNRKSIDSFKKTVLGISKVAFRLRDRYVFTWQSLEILNPFWKTETLFNKLEDRF